MTSTYLPASSLGWLDLDTAASDRAAELLRAFDEPSTLDPIGLGVIRDSFADQLHPGTSTVQTQLRYFLFLPWIFQRLEHERVAPASFGSTLRRYEAQLIDCLRHLGPNNGTIGYYSGAALKRLPSNVYWGGLGTWHIRRLDLSLNEYAQRLPRLTDPSARSRDDDGNVIDGPRGMWMALPPPPDGFLSEQTSFELTPEEAAAVTDAIRSSNPTSLLAHALASPGRASEAHSPWEIDRALLPTHLLTLLEHARNASTLTWGPQLLYNLLLAERATHDLGWNTTPLQEDQRSKLDRWADVIAADHRLGRWAAADLEDFWDHVARARPVSPALRAFTEQIIVRSIDDPHGLADDPAARNLVARREHAIKGPRARLDGPLSNVENWNQAPFGSRLDYRWPTARRYLVDVAAALDSR